MRLNSENDLLNESLAALRNSYTEQPPPHIESFLAARLRTERHRKAARLWMTAGGLCAALILLAWFGTRPMRQPGGDAPVATSDQTRAASPVPASVEHPPDAEHVAVATQPKRPPAIKRRRRADKNQQDALAPAPFIAIPYTEPLAPYEQLDIYRVQLPRATLSVYGVPARGAGLEVPVVADVAVGSDGVVRAVRFVR